MKAITYTAIAIWCGIFWACVAIGLWKIITQ